MLRQIDVTKRSKENRANEEEREQKGANSGWLLDLGYMRDKMEKRGSSTEAISTENVDNRRFT